MAPKRDTASQVAPGSSRREPQRNTLNQGVNALEALTVTLKRSSTCSSTCSCGSIQDIAAAMKAADGEISGSLCPGSLLEIIRVLSSLAAVLITDQHSFAAQRATLELLERLVGRPIRALFPLSPFPADASKFSQQDLLSPKFLLGAQMAITFCEAGLVPALQTQATGWNNHCTIVTQRLRLFKTVQALANSTQEQQYQSKAQDAATSLGSYCAILKDKSFPLQCIYMWGCSTLLAQPLLHTAGAAVQFAPLAHLAAVHLQLMRLLQQCVESGMQLPAPFESDPWEWEVVNSSTQGSLWSMMSALASALPDACGCLKACPAGDVQAQQLQQLMSSPELIVPLTLALLCGGHALKHILQAYPLLQPYAAAGAAGDPCGLPDHVSAADSSTGGSSSSGGGGGSDPWIVAEGVLLVRVEQLQSQAAGAHQLTAVLRYSRRVCQQWWQQLHCPGDLQAITKSYRDVGMCSMRPADMVRTSQFNSALELLLHILQQQRLLAAVKPHAASALQVLLSAAAAVMPTALWDADSAVPMVEKCLDAGASLAKLLPVHSAADKGAGQQQQQQQQQKGLSGFSRQQHGAAGPNQQQLLGSMLHLLQQLLLFVTQPPPVDANDSDDCDSCSLGSIDSSSSDGSSSGASSNRGEAAGVLDPLSSEGKQRDAPLNAMSHAPPLLQQLLEPLMDCQQLAACLQHQHGQQQLHGQQRQQGPGKQLLNPVVDPQQLAACLQQQQQQHWQQQQLLEQVTWALQVTEASVRALVAAGTAPVQQATSALLEEHRAKNGQSSLDSPELQLLQARRTGFTAGVTPLLHMVSCSLGELLQLPGAWEGLKSSVQGQQLLQAGLSLLLVYKQASLGRESFVQLPLMQLVSRDIRAFLAGNAEGSCPTASSQQQQQLLLPHPQLVVCVLALAAQCYKRLHKHLLHLTKERVARPGEAPNMYEVAQFCAAYFAPLAASTGTAAGAAAGARAKTAAGAGAATASAAGSSSAGVDGAADVDAGVSAAAGSSVAGVDALADDDDNFSSYSSTLHELLQALSALTKASCSHTLHKQQQHQQGQPPSPQQQQQQGQQQQQQLPPEWAMVLQGNALKVLLPALLRAAGELNAAVTAAAPHLQQWQLGAASLSAELADVRQRLLSTDATLMDTREQLSHPSLSRQRRAQLQLQETQRNKEWDEAIELQWGVALKLVPAPRPLLTGLAKWLHVMGTLLSSLPSRFHCSNFDCTSLSTVSEAFALVRGRSCVCGGCVTGLTGSEVASREVHAARYCSVDCQRQHFHVHKWVCGTQQQFDSSTAAAGSSPAAASGCAVDGSSSGAGASGSSGGGGSSSSAGLEATVSAVLTLAAARAEEKVSGYHWLHDV